MTQIKRIIWLEAPTFPLNGQTIVHHSQTSFVKLLVGLSPLAFGQFDHCGFGSHAVQFILMRPEHIGSGAPENCLFSTEYL